MIAEFLSTHPVAQFFAVLGASQFLFSWWRGHTRKHGCRHEWGRGYELKGIQHPRARRHQWRKCKLCHSTQLRYQLARYKAWHLTEPVHPDDLLPTARVVER